MQLYLIRHAHAGSRSAWDQPDHERPLSPKGAAQAAEIATALAGRGIDLLWSSPSLRCRQTLEPLGAALGLKVVASDPFDEGSSGPAALDAALAAVGAGHTLAVCSHGDVLPAMASAAVRRGATLHGTSALHKGARFECTVVDGQIAELTLVDVPKVQA